MKINTNGLKESNYDGLDFMDIGILYYVQHCYNSIKNMTMDELIKEAIHWNGNENADSVKMSIEYLVSIEIIEFENK